MHNLPVFIIVVKRNCHFCFISNIFLRYNKETDFTIIKCMKNLQKEQNMPINIKKRKKNQTVLHMLDITNIRYTSKVEKKLALMGN